MKNILLLVDPLNDFADKNGSLYVPGGEDIIPVINDIMELKWDDIILIQDWHPQEHKSFASNNEGTNLFSTIELNGIQQVMWPEHCIQNTWGSEPHKDLNKKWTFVIQKGENTDLDSYSAFYENDGVTKTGMLDLLSHIIPEGEDVSIFITGLATDYCVKYTALDAKKHFEHVILIEDAIEGINDDDVTTSLNEMFDKGIHEVDSGFLINEMNE